MALQKTITLDSGITAENSYHRIDTVAGSKTEIAIQVNSYVSKDAYTEGKALLKSEVFSFVPDLSGDNFIAQGYAYLKTLPEYAAAVDC